MPDVKLMLTWSYKHGKQSADFTVERFALPKISVKHQKAKSISSRTTRAKSEKRKRKWEKKHSSNKSREGDKHSSNKSKESFSSYRFLLTMPINYATSTPDVQVHARCRELASPRSRPLSTKSGLCSPPHHLVAGGEGKQPRNQGNCLELGASLPLVASSAGPTQGAPA